MIFFDTNVWHGSWAFAPLPRLNPAALARALQRNDIVGAMVSQFDCVFQFDPMPGNRALLKALQRQESLYPLPVLNLATPMWREHLQSLASNRRVRAIRLLPAYHAYDLSLRKYDDAIAAIADSGLRIIVTSRLVDERHEHHAVRIKPVPVKRLARFLERHPKVNPLIHGLSRFELEALAKSQELFSVDTSFLEWEDSLRVASDFLAASRIQMGSTTPLQVTQSHADKIRFSSLPAAQKRAVAFQSAYKFFNLQSR